MPVYPGALPVTPLHGQNRALRLFVTPPNRKLEYKTIMDNREAYPFFAITVLSAATALYSQLIQVGPRNPHACEEVKVAPNLILASESRVEGHIKDPSGAVFVHTRIELRRYVSEVKQTSFRHAQTDVDGSFSLGVVSAGRYRFIIFAPGFKQPVDLKCAQTNMCDLNVVPGIASTDTFPESVCPPK